MDKIEISESFVYEHYRKLKVSQASESTIFLHNDSIIKVLRNNYRKDREDVVFKLASNNINHTVKIDSLLYDKGKFYGYTMPYLKNYKLYSDVSHKSLIDRKDYAYQILNVFNELLDKLDIIYYDFHTQNFLVKKHDLQLIDIDSCYKEVNNIRLHIGMYNLLNLIMEIIYNIPFDDLRLIASRKNLDVEILKYLKQNINFKDKYTFNYSDICNLIDNVDKKELKRIKKEIPRSIYI